MAYWLETSTHRNTSIYLRVYQVNPWEYPGAGNIGVLKRVDFDTRELKPVVVKYNVQFRDCELDHIQELIDWQEVVKMLAVQLEARVTDKAQLKLEAIEAIRQQFIDEAVEYGWQIVEKEAPGIDLD